ncbi:MAG TPA: four helix bundle protein [Balneolaceae bacterium]|nr:four helix bundle protein [Balneolaceae bacterium]
MNQFGFEKLNVWDKSKDFVIKVYRVTEGFPDSEKFGLVSQLRRASVSVSSNIAEGSSRRSAREQGRFYTISYSSAIEALNQLIISKDLGYISISNYKELRNDLEEVTAMLNQLHKSTKRKC